MRPRGFDPDAIELSVEEWEQEVGRLYGDRAGDLIAAYRDEAETAGARKALQRMDSDVTFAWDMREWVRLADRAGVPAYHYLFEHAPFARGYGRRLGAFHAGDIPFVFGELEGRPWTSGDEDVSRLMHAYWVNFARSGDPNGPGLPHWPRYQASHPVTLRIRHPAEPAVRYRDDKLDLHQDG